MLAAAEISNFLLDSDLDFVIYLFFHVHFSVVVSSDLILISPCAETTKVSSSQTERRVALTIGTRASFRDFAGASRKISRFSID